MWTLTSANNGVALAHRGWIGGTRDACRTALPPGEVPTRAASLASQRGYARAYTHPPNAVNPWRITL